MFKNLKIIWFWFFFSKLVVNFLSMKYGEPDKQRETLAEAWKDRWVWWNPGLELHTTQFWNLEVRISVSDVIGGDRILLCHMYMEQNFEKIYQEKLVLVERLKWA